MDTDVEVLRAASKRSRSGGDSLEATRLSLLTRLKDYDDQDGWQRFLDTYGGVVRALALQAGLTPVDADEVLQETLISVVKEMPKFQYDPSRGTFKGWLFRITRRRIADHFRKATRKDHFEIMSEASWENLPESDLAKDPLNLFWEAEWRIHLVQKAIDLVKERVSPAQWQLFDLAAIQCWPTEKICALLQVNRAQVYMARMRVGRLLKSELGRQPEWV